VEQLKRHAKSLAKLHQLTNLPEHDKLLPRLAENDSLLIETYDILTAVAALDRRIESAGEWLLDNFYLIEEQILAIRRHLPPSYSRELPSLGYCRVFTKCCRDRDRQFCEYRTSLEHHIYE